MASPALPSWSSSPTREAIVRFVDTVTCGTNAVRLEDRVAVFDNDGTLWPEKPMPVQVHFIVEKWRGQSASVAEFMSAAHHPTLHRSYAQTAYQPMVELLRFLADNSFTCYIVSVGDRDFMRPIVEQCYGIPPERVIGSALGLRYDNAIDDVRYESTFEFMDDGPEKPVRILGEAVGRGYTVASVQRDWATIFAPLDQPAQGAFVNGPNTQGLFERKP
ncbi:HAD family hydrolase [Rhodococcus sp. KBS0724]|jgi:hypothetical protein|uniref:HAD family hydrolase n=1 Tax=Rhodococcus sp. KBS0724 TaxID=1179674 RepID=UPI0021B094D2|nr:HAD family hydrolase [Rhodococcus sp. KBS0724]